MNRPVMSFCFVTLLLLAVFSAAGCASQGSETGMGTLTGNVTVGPLTPVERVGVTPPVPDPAVFTSRKLLLYEADGRTLIETIDIQPAGYHGVYSVSLKPGVYVLDYPRQGVGGAKGLPATVTIEAGKTTRLDVDIDTGIR